MKTRPWQRPGTRLRGGLTDLPEAHSIAQVFADHVWWAIQNVPGDCHVADATGQVDRERYGQIRSEREQAS
jgi:hypothetical protein